MIMIKLLIPVLILFGQHCSTEGGKMTSSTICSSLLRMAWQPYDPALAPVSGGIYCIGRMQFGSVVEVIYVGRSQNIHHRLQSHIYGKQKIDQHIRKMFAANKGSLLYAKWILDPNNRCNEGEYLKCIAAKLGYWPEFNLRKGSSCA